MVQVVPRIVPLAGYNALYAARREPRVAEVHLQRSFYGRWNLLSHLRIESMPASHRSLAQGRLAL
jgi:hypothetical protein